MYEFNYIIIIPKIMYVIIWFKYKIFVKINLHYNFMLSFVMLVSLAFLDNYYFIVISKLHSTLLKFSVITLAPSLFSKIGIDLISHIHSLPFSFILNIYSLICFNQKKKKKKEDECIFLKIRSNNFWHNIIIQHKYDTHYTGFRLSLYRFRL